MFNADVSSLYHTSMAGNDIFHVKFPVGILRWSNIPKWESKNNRLRYYEIEYFAPKDINYPILPRRKDDGGIMWDLENGKGVYTNVDIRNSIKVGYKVRFINKCLVYDNSRDDIFSWYINKFYNLKAAEDNKPEDERNDAKRNICKLMMNGLYGKMLQCPIFEHEIIANNINDVYEFLKDNDFIDLDILDENKILIKGKPIVDNEDECINKLSQFDAFVLSYSRVLMQFYNTQLDPTLKKFTVSYTDTDSLHISGNYKKK